MPDRLFSVFGTYDFFGKSLPGLVFVVGMAPLLPNESLPIPNLADNFLTIIVILIVATLIGTLLGEVIHTAAIFVESLIEHIGRQVRRVLVFLTRGHFGPPSKPDIAKFQDSDGNLPSLDELRDRRVIGWFVNRYEELYEYAYEMYVNFTYIFWSHRNIFYNRISSELDDGDDQSFTTPVAAEPFTKKHLLEKSIDDYDVKSFRDVEEIYSVVTGTIARSDSNRAFKFQSMFSFCRSMWIILIAIAASYWLVVMVPFGFPFKVIALNPLQLPFVDPNPTIGFLPRQFTIPIVPEMVTAPGAFKYNSYLTAELDGESTLAVIWAFVLSSVIFAWASGRYKQYYIEYLISEFYIATDKESDSGDVSNGSGPAS